MYLLRDLFSVAVSPMVGAISGTGAVSTLIPSYRDMLEYVYIQLASREEIYCRLRAVCLEQ